MKNKVFFVGAVAGGILGLVAALGMDFLSGDIPGGGWVSAAAHDLNLPPGSPAAYVAAAFAICIMVLISAALGGLCAVLLEHFFKIFTRE